MKHFRKYLQVYKYKLNLCCQCVPCINEICLSVYYSLFFSHLSYGCLSWLFTSNCLINKLSVLQRRAVRIMSFSEFTDSTSPFFYRFNILKVTDVFESRLLLFFHSYSVNDLPISLFEFFNYFDAIIYSCLNPKRFQIPIWKTSKFGKRSIRVAGVQVWNKFNESISDKSTINTKLKLKNLHSKKCIDSYL
jgi:hypothetical protein